MLNTKIYKCSKCGAIKCVSKSQTTDNKIICSKCNDRMIELDDDFDLAEIIEIVEEDNHGN